MKKRVWLCAAGIVLIIILQIIRFSGEKEEAVTDKVTMVETVHSQKKTVSLYTSLIGTVEPETVARIYAEASGNVTEVFVKAGDGIAAGQNICTVDTKQVETAQHDRDNANINYQEAQVTLSRMQVLYQAGDISEQEYQGYVNSAKRAEISYLQASENYEKQLSYSNVTSPIDGYVEKIDVEALDKVAAGSQICVVSSPGNKIISSSLTESLRKKTKLGDTVEIEKAGNFYEGVIFEMSEMVDETTGLYPIKIQLSEESNLTTGTVVKLSVCSDRAEDALTVPVDSIYYENSLPYLYTYDNGIIHKVFVTTGIYDSENMVILDGMEEDAEVVFTWSPELYEGAEAMRAETENQ